MDRPTLYIETSIVSYLAARPSRDPVTLRNQQLTHAWWNQRRHDYALFTSRGVLDEIERGDSGMAARRMELLVTIPVVELHHPELLLARTLQQQIPLPPRAGEDALHMPRQRRTGWLTCSRGTGSTSRIHAFRHASGVFCWRTDTLRP